MPIFLKLLPFALGAAVLLASCAGAGAGRDGSRWGSGWTAAIPAR